MRAVAFALLSALALAACNPSTPQGSGAANDAGDGAFPNLAQASYRAEATITDRNGRTTPIVMIRDGGKMRMEVTTGEGQSTIINNAETGESFIIANAGGQLMAMRATAMNGLENPADAWNAELATSATRTGSCSVAGQEGAEWTRVEDDVTKTACVTHDGILLRSTEGERTVWETTSVERGPQSADLFVVPAGVQIVDLSNIGGMADALARARDAQQGQ